MLTICQLIPDLDSGGVERGTLEVGKALVEAGTPLDCHLGWRAHGGPARS